LWLNGRRARLCAIVDVTDKVRAEQELNRLVESLQEAKSEAERANRLKSAFLANMSHEIRTPLGAIIGFADLLREPDLSREEHDNFLNIITRNGEQLAAIINDILDLSKVEAGHLTLEYAKVRPEDVAHDVISLLQVKAREKNLVLEFNQDESMPAQVTTDSLRLRQILMNVVGNAIKFTPSGAVKIKGYGREDNGKKILSYEVADTGIGIPASQQERIFDAFVQVDGTLSRKFGGTGLGLALSRELARHLGGDVRIEKSLEGKGTTFIISIEDRTAPQSKQEPASPKTEISTASVPAVTRGVLSGMEVLVVDDSPDNRQLIWRCLSKQGAEVEFAENGARGYEKALAGNFDVVLMDIQMPEMDGYTATEKLRHSGYRRPIIALTAHAMNEVRQKCIDAGCTDHLTKPIRMKELVDTVARYATN
jgi:CheY-like chemotaxis protein